MRLMTNANLGEALRLLGVGQAAARAYLTLLELAPASRSEIAAAAGLDGPGLATAYAELVDAGLAGAADRDEDVVMPVAPAAALEVLARHRAAELEKSRIAVAGAFDSFRRRQLTAHDDPLVEIVTGDAVGPRMRQAWAAPATRSGSSSHPPTSLWPVPPTTHWPRWPAGSRNASCTPASRWNARATSNKSSNRASTPVSRPEFCRPSP